jgi:hypothetical protein
MPNSALIRALVLHAPGRYAVVPAAPFAAVIQPHAVRASGGIVARMETVATERRRARAGTAGAG